MTNEKRIIGTEKDLNNDKEFNRQIGCLIFHLKEEREETELSKAVRKLLDIVDNYDTKLIIGEYLS